MSFCRNVASDGAALTEDGRAFHVRAADTGNALSPSVEQSYNIRKTQTAKIRYRKELMNERREMYESY